MRNADSRDFVALGRRGAEPRRDCRGSPPPKLTAPWGSVVNVKVGPLQNYSSDSLGLNANREVLIRSNFWVIDDLLLKKLATPRRVKVRPLYKPCLPRWTAPCSNRHPYTCEGSLRRSSSALAGGGLGVSSAPRPSRFGLVPVHLVKAFEWLPGRDAPGCPVSSPS